MECAGAESQRRNVRINAAGDATISNITQDADTTYGFRGNELVVNQTSGTVSVNSAGRSSITQITLPSSGSVALDLSQTTNLALSSSYSITNKTSLAAITFPQSSFSIGNGVFSSCYNLSGPIDLSHCTSVGNNAFFGCNKITSANLTNCATIGENAFAYCTNLASITLTGCTTIKKEAFKECDNLISADLSSCTNLDGNVFDGCNKLKTVVLGSHITTIGGWTFRDCVELENIDLSNCTSIGTKAFQRCKKLTSVNLSKCTSIGKMAFHDCTELAGELNLPACEIIEGGAFQHDKKITKIILSSRLQRVGKNPNKENDDSSYSFSDINESTEIIFNKNPTSGITYNKWAFSSNQIAKWDDNGTIRTYKWNNTACRWDLQS